MAKDCKLSTVKLPLGGLPRNSLVRITDNEDIIRILHECEVLIEKSVPRVTVWHHEALPSDAKL